MIVIILMLNIYIYIYINIVDCFRSMFCDGERRTLGFGPWSSGSYYIYIYIYIYRNMYRVFFGSCDRWWEAMGDRRCDVFSCYFWARVYLIYIYIVAFVRDHVCSVTMEGTVPNSTIYVRAVDQHATLVVALERNMVYLYIYSDIHIYI